MTSEDLMNCFPYFIQLVGKNVENDIARPSYSVPPESPFTSTSDILSSHFLFLCPGEGVPKEKAPTQKPALLANPRSIAYNLMILASYWISLSLC